MKKNTCHRNSVTGILLCMLYTRPRERQPIMMPASLRTDSFGTKTSLRFLQRFATIDDTMYTVSSAGAGRFSMSLYEFAVTGIPLMVSPVAMMLHDTRAGTSAFGSTRIGVLFSSTMVIECGVKFIICMIIVPFIIIFLA